MHVANVNELPKTSGVYKFFDINQNLLYIGKATNLRSRVKSYFTNKNHAPRTKRLVKLINWIEFILTDNEKSAKILENNLILLLNPQFNILKIEEPKFTVIELTTHNFPQIRLSKISYASQDYFGPYPNKSFAINKLKIIQKLFKLRTCSDKEFVNRSSPCISYQLKLCSGACVNKISSSEYITQVNKAEQLLIGDYSINKFFKTQMNNAATQYNFELAASYRDALKVVTQFKLQQTISYKLKTANCDIYKYQVNSENKIFIYLLIVRNGMFIGDKHWVYNLDTNVTEFLTSFLKKRYLAPRAKTLNIIYLDHYLTKFKQEYTIKLTSDVKNIFIEQMIFLASNNLTQIIDNYNYNNLYAGGIINLQNILKLDKITSIKYVVVNDKIKCIEYNKKIIKAYCANSLDNCLTDIAEVLFFEFTSLEIEQKVIETLKRLHIKTNIIFIKPVLHSKKMIILLEKDYTYTSQNLITCKNLSNFLNYLKLN